MWQLSGKRKISSGRVKSNDHWMRLRFREKTWSIQCKYMTIVKLSISKLTINLAALFELQCNCVWMQLNLVKASLWGNSQKRSPTPGNSSDLASDRLKTGADLSVLVAPPQRASLLSADGQWLIKVEGYSLIEFHSPPKSTVALLSKQNNFINVKIALG